MLQVEPYFRMALEALESVKTGDALLEVPALPVLVATAQRDFLNSYHHALTHYLPISLKEPYLQNSSIGSPYEKWLKFTNEDCEAFDYDFWMLLQNTSRLWHDIYMRNPSAVVKKGGPPDWRSLNYQSNYFTGLICARKYDHETVGLIVRNDETIEKRFISWGDYEPHVESETILIGKRSVIKKLIKPLHQEWKQLTKLHNQFRTQCRNYLQAVDLLGDYTTANESWRTINGPNPRYPQMP